MGTTASRKRNEKTENQQNLTKDQEQGEFNEVFLNSRNIRKQIQFDDIEEIKNKDQARKPKAITKTTTAENPAAAATRTKAITSSSSPSLPSSSQRLKQNSSTWSLNSLLSSRFNWSFSGGSRQSFRHRNKSTRKSLTNLQTHQQQQEQQKRSKTTWHKPMTNAIFSSHFKESSHIVEKYQIEQLVAKGAFGIVFKVIDKQQLKEQQEKQQQRKDHQQDHQHQSNIVKVNEKEIIGQSSSSSAIATTSVARVAAVTELSSSSSSSHQQQKPTFFALKVLKKSKIIAENSVQQIKDEADIQKICGHHPFIVQQFSLWQNRHNLLILSEFVPNGELFSTIVNFSLDLVRLYLAEIALAIDFLHNAGIIYRDAKPENILLTEHYHIKLTDFGLSKWLKLGMTTKTMCGTFQYMGTI